MFLVPQRFRLSNRSQRLRKTRRPECDTKAENRHLHFVCSRNHGCIDVNRGAKTTGHIGNRGEPEIKRVRTLRFLHRGVATVEFGVGPRAAPGAATRADSTLGLRDGYTGRLSVLTTPVF